MFCVIVGTSVLIVSTENKKKMCSFKYFQLLLKRDMSLNSTHVSPKTLDQKKGKKYLFVFLQFQSKLNNQPTVLKNCSRSRFRKILPFKPRRNFSKIPNGAKSARNNVTLLNYQTSSDAWWGGHCIS